MLTAQEKVAGRAFLDMMQTQLTQSLADQPPTYIVPNVLAVFRHDCERRRNRSTALTLQECYVRSPAVPEYGIPEGRFGYIYRAGTCRGCGQTARSKNGRLVDGWVRPPLAGRVARA